MAKALRRIFALTSSRVTACWKGSTTSASRFSTSPRSPPTKPSTRSPPPGKHSLMHRLIIKTAKKREVLDITELVEDQLADSSSVSGICHLFVLHATAALTTADLDPGTDLDMLDAFEAMVPKLRYRHP